MPFSESVEALDVNEVLSFFRPGGIFSRSLKGFETRPQQQAMIHNVVNAYNSDQIALIEAGTGTGKSIAYLVPALLWAVKNKERTVISTHTINLQEQLISKDIPFLLKELGVDAKAVLVKGMNNYICPRRLSDALEQRSLLLDGEQEELQRLEKWASVTQEGSRADLTFVPSPTVWDNVGAEGDACTHIHCPHYKTCFFFQARRQAADAQILVVNHHLLFADLSLRAEGGESSVGILPNYSRLVLDEAHHLEDIATEHFASSVSRLELLRLLGKLGAEKQEVKIGKLPLLKQKMIEHFAGNQNGEVTSILNRLDIDLPGERRLLNQKIHEVFSALTTLPRQFGSLTEKEGEASVGEQKLRIRQQQIAHPYWTEDIQPQMQLLIESIRHYAQMLVSLEADLERLENEKFNEKTRGIRFDIKSTTSRLDHTCETLQNFAFKPEAPSTVRWMESGFSKKVSNLHLVIAELDIAALLAQMLFNKFDTVIMCSATLAANQKFNFVRQRLGLTQELLEEREVTENIYDSPFNYEHHALLAVPKDIPNPTDPRFNASAAESMWEAIQACRGGAFLLFTSFGMLKDCHARLIERLEKGGYSVFKQGDGNRRALLENFKEAKRAVLFGTDSFWEGVDVVGESLRCVVIAKLPFKVPSEPIIQARTEAIIAAGKDPFFEYTLPQAIVKFKQGFGRLIRHQRDRGCIVCLDSRLISKPYGKLFLNSLPKCIQLFEKSDVLQEKMAEFYRKTYYLVKSEEGRE